MQNRSLAGSAGFFSLVLQFVLVLLLLLRHCRHASVGFYFVRWGCFFGGGVIILIVVLLIIME